MHADLMRAARIDFDIEQGEFAETRLQPANYAVMRDRAPPTFEPRGHTTTPYAIAADALINGSRIFFHPPVHQSNVFLLHFARGKLPAQLGMGCIVFGHDDETAGFFIEPMDD